MASRFDIKITADPKGAENAIDRLNKRFEAWSKQSERVAKPLTNIEKTLGRILKPWGLEKFTGDFGKWGQSISTIGSAFDGAAGGLEGFGAAASSIALPLAAAAGAAVASGAAIGKAAKSWDYAGASLKDLSGVLGINIGLLQDFAGAAGTMGKSQDAAVGSLMGIKNALFGAATGSNKEAAIRLGASGIAVPDASKPIDLAKWLPIIVGLIAKQRPGSDQQLATAAAFGVSPDMLPFIAQGWPKIAKERAEFRATAGPYTDADADAAAAGRSHWSRFDEAVKGVQRQFGRMADKAAGPVLDFGTTMAAGGTSVLGRALPNSGKGGKQSLIGWAADIQVPIMDRIGKLIGSDTSAWDAWRERMNPQRHPGRQPGKPGAAAAPGASTEPSTPAFERLARAIEQRESYGGHQFRRPGVPLVSGAGAIGAMQLMDATARRVALAHGIAFDEHRLRFDKAYNEQLGRLHLGDLLKKYGGNETLASAAYNAGEPVVDDWLHGTNQSGKNPRRRRLPDPRAGGAAAAAFRGDIPFGETRDYVAATTPEPQRVEVSVRFQNAPPGTVAEAKSPTGAKISLETGMSLPFSRAW